MGSTVVSTRVASRTIENDDDVDVKQPEGGGVPTVAFASMGSGPATNWVKGGSARFKLKVTSGTGTPAIAANNIQITCARNVRKVFLAVTGTNTPAWHVASISSAVINIGTKVAPAASTAYEFELIVLF